MSLISKIHKQLKMIFSFKMFFSKKMRVTISPAFVFIVSLNTQVQKVDFSGSWKLDRNKTDFGKLSENTVPIKVSINQTSDTILIDRFTKNSQDELHSYIERLPLNGNSIENMTNLYTKKIASIQLEDDAKLTEIAQYINYSDNVRYKGIETWILSNAGNTLTVTREDKANGSSYFRKMVYDKQSLALRCF